MIKLARVLLPNEQTHVALVDGESFRVLDMSQLDDYRTLADILHAPDPIGLANYLVDPQYTPVSRDQVQVLSPVDRQEIWAAGVTYKRSQQARMEESEHGASHYDRVYSAERPELFFKAPAYRVVPPGSPVRVRSDSEWSVPEPELALFLTPEMKIAGYSIGNDMSARDIEGENPLYLPQAKVYNQSCSVGPVVLVSKTPLNLAETTVSLAIHREHDEVFSGQTTLDQLNRKLEDLAGWLGRELDFPSGAVLLTGTGIVPSDDFSLEQGDMVTIEISGIGKLVNPVVKE